MSDHRGLIPARLAAALGGLRSEQRGMTVVEVMVAAMILLIGIVPTVKVFDDSRDQNATGERHEIALFQAEQALEEMRGLPYNRLLLAAGAVDPGASGRVTADGASLRVREDLTETLVYPGTEGVPTTNAWVEPVSGVTIGPSEAPVDLTIHRFVTWRDEECRVADLSGLGIDLPATVQGILTPLIGSVTGLLNNLLGIISNSDIQLLRTRLTALQNALNANLTGLNSALAGISELDLCDLDLTLLEEVQQLSQLNLGITADDGLVPLLNGLEGELDNLLNNLCLPLVGCPLSTVNGDVVAVNAKLDEIFGAGSGSIQFNNYLTGLIEGLAALDDDLADTERNTKRITVAVTVEERSGAGPYEPVWASSVVRDTSAGLLTGGGAAG